MKLSRCPVCHSHIHLDALVQDEAGRELLAKLAKLNSTLASSLLQYVGLFRPTKSDLNNARALKLLNETLAVTSNMPALAQACEATVRNIHQKRQSGEQIKPLTNHNYLKQVLNSVVSTFNPALNTPSTVEVKHQTTINKAEEAAKWREQMAKYGMNIDPVKLNK